MFIISDWNPPLFVCLPVGRDLLVLTENRYEREFMAKGTWPLQKGHAASENRTNLVCARRGLLCYHPG